MTKKLLSVFMNSILIFSGAMPQFVARQSVTMRGPIASPAPTSGNVFTFGQKASCTGTTTCSFTGLTITSGNLGTIEILGTGVIVSISTTAGTWNLSPGTCQDAPAGNLDVDCAWIPSETGGSNVTITVTATPGANVLVTYADYSYTGPTPTLVAATASTETTCSTACTGQTFSLSHGSIVTQEINPAVSCSSVSGNAFTSPAWTSFASGNGWAGSAVNTTNGGTPTWTCVAGVATTNGMAIQ